MYPVGKAIAQAISQADASITVNLSASEGSVSNALALQNGEIDLGLVSRSLKALPAGTCGSLPPYIPASPTGSPPLRWGSPMSMS